MEQIKVASLSSRLTTLDIARERLASVEESMSCAKSVYTHAIQLLEDAMATDPTVVECQELIDEYQDLYLEALHQTQFVAISAWEGGFTNGKKEWGQDGWEVRLRSTKTPKVTDPDKFIHHLDHLDAEINSVIKSITLNKKATTDLNDGISGGLAGLDVEEKTSCSLKKSTE